MRGITRWMRRAGRPASSSTCLSALSRAAKAVASAVASEMADPVKISRSNSPPIRLSHHCGWPSTDSRGASTEGAPGRIAGAAKPLVSAASASAVFAGLSSATVGVDSRPLLTMRRANGSVAANSRAALRNDSAIGDLGEMKSVLRVELRMFSSAAACRSCAQASRTDSLASPRTTRTSRQASASASWMPELPPRAPKGETWCAASPANSIRPWRKASMRRHWKV